MADTVAQDPQDFETLLHELLNSEHLKAIEEAKAQGQAKAPRRVGAGLQMPEGLPPATRNALSGDDYDTSDVLARMAPKGPPRVPFYGANDAILPEPKSRQGGQQYVELPGMRLPRGLTGRDAIGMASTAPMMMGMTGGPSGAVTGGLKYAAENIPKAPAAIAAALTGLTAGPGRGGENDPDALAQAAAGKQLYEERARLEQQLRTATARREENRPQGRAPSARDPIYNEAAAEVSKLEAQQAANQQMIADHVRRNSPEFALQMKQKAAEQERQAQEERAATPTRKLYSDYLPALPFVTGGLALAGGAALKGRSMANFQTEIADLSTRIAQALSTARSAPRGSVAADAAANEARGLVAEYQTLRSQHERFFDPGTKKAMMLGGTLGFEQAYGPEEIDLARAVLGNPLWSSLKKDFFDEYPTTLARGALSTAIGGGLGKLGALGIEPFMSQPTPTGYAPAVNALPPPRRPGGGGSPGQQSIAGPRGQAPVAPTPTQTSPETPPTPTTPPVTEPTPTPGGSRAQAPEPQAPVQPKPQSQSADYSSPPPGTKLAKDHEWDDRLTGSKVRAPDGKIAPMSKAKSSGKGTAEPDPASEYFKDTEGKLLKGSDARPNFFNRLFG